MKKKYIIINQDGECLAGLSDHGQVRVRWIKNSKHPKRAAKKYATDIEASLMTDGIYRRFQVLCYVQEVK